MAKLNYELVGEGSGGAVVFLHGFLGDASDWLPIVEVISKHRRCLTIDLPGHGKSISLEASDFSMDKAARTVVDLLDSLGIDRCDLVGYSMGGRLAYYLLVHYPDRFARAIVESATPGIENESQKTERIKSDEALASQIELLDSQSGLEEFLMEWYSQPLFRSLKDDPDRLRAAVDRRKVSDPKMLAQSLRMMGTGRMPNLWGKLDKITASLLLIAGAKDDKFKAIASRASSKCRSSKLAIFEEAGHNVHLEKPESYLKLVAGFLGIER